ncbi:MAG: stage III sporulation protein AB [Ruminococcus sp.]
MNCFPVKALGCVFLVAASFAAGCLLSRRLYRRREFLRRFGAFLSLLKTNLRYRGEDVFTLVRLCAEQAELPFLSVEKTGEDFTVVWERALKAIPKTFALSESDHFLLRELGSQLGATDLEGQLRHLEVLETQAAARLSESEERIQSKAKLYKTMGFFAGASAAIVLM